MPDYSFFLRVTVQNIDKDGNALTPEQEHDGWAPDGKTHTVSSVPGEYMSGFWGLRTRVYLCTRKNVNPGAFSDPTTSVLQQCWPGGADHYDVQYAMGTSPCPATDVTNAHYVADDSGNLITYPYHSIGVYQWIPNELDWTQPSSAVDPSYWSSILTEQMGYADSGGVWHPDPNDPDENSALYHGRYVTDSGQLEGGPYLNPTAITVSYKGDPLPFPAALVAGTSTPNPYRTLRRWIYAISASGKNQQNQSLETLTLQTCWPGNADHFDLTPADQLPAMDLTQTNLNTVNRAEFDVVDGQFTVKGVDLSKAFNFGSPDFSITGGKLTIAGVDFSKGFNGFTVGGTVPKIAVSVGGANIGWIGYDSLSGYTGAWFQRLLVGGASPEGAALFADFYGNVAATRVTLYDASGNYGWIGSKSGYIGAWFPRLFIGGVSPATAKIVADSSGNVAISGDLITGGTINGVKVVVTSSSGSFTKTVTIDPAGYSNPIRVANSAGSATVMDASFLSVTSSGETSYLYVNELQLNDPYGGVRIDGTRVLGTQKAGPGNTTDTTDVAIRFNNLLTALRGHGLIT